MGSYIRFAVLLTTLVVALVMLVTFVIDYNALPATSLIASVPEKNVTSDPRYLRTEQIRKECQALTDSNKIDLVEHLTLGKHLQSVSNRARFLTLASNVQNRLNRVNKLTGEWRTLLNQLVKEYPNDITQPPI